MNGEYYVYIMANKTRTIYIWVTNNLERRVYEHKNKIFEKWFTSKYNCNKLVYFEKFGNIWQAIEAEKKVKKYKRERKLELIQKNNPSWRDLSLE
jgi:putative endonuclease